MSFEWLFSWVSPPEKEALQPLWETCFSTMSLSQLCLYGTSCVSVCNHCFSCYRWAPLKRVLTSSLKTFVYIIKIPSQPSLLQAKCSQPFLMRETLQSPNLCRLSPIVPVLSCSGEPRSGHSIPDVPSPGLRREITSLNLLAALFDFK